MKIKIKTILKDIIPKRFHKQINEVLFRRKIKDTEKIFRVSKPSPNYLSIEDLEKMQLNYEYPPEYGYSSDILNKRGRERTDFLINLIPNNFESILELGCWDGMVSFHLNKMGKKSVGIDNRDEGFDKRAIDLGVDLLKMDASKLEFNDSSFDVAFSYDAFEHFDNPRVVLSEMYRVVKPGGYIYLEFGPLFYAPKGLHVYRQITVPYCQILFSKETLVDFVTNNNLGTIDFNHCNGWTLFQFENLWKEYSKKLIQVKYVKNNDYKHLDLINKYPQIFKSKTDNLENLLCSSIAILFKKI